MSTKTRTEFYGLGDGNNQVRLRTLKVVLTDAELKALPTTPLALVAAPGAGKTAVPLHYYLVMKAVADYTNINPDGFLYARYVGGGEEASGYLGNDSGIAVVNQFTSLFAFGGGEKRYQLPHAYFDDRGAANGWGLVADVLGNASENAAIELAVNNNGSGNLTGGNAANTLAVHIVYAVLTTS